MNRCVMVLADLALMSGAQLFIREDIGLSGEHLDLLEIGRAHV